MVLDAKNLDTFLEGMQGKEEMKEAIGKHVNIRYRGNTMEFKNYKGSRVLITKKDKYSFNIRINNNDKEVEMMLDIPTLEKIMEFVGSGEDTE